MDRQKIWLAFFGSISSIVGLLGLFHVVPISVFDAIVHLLTGAVCGGVLWFYKGKQLNEVNFFLGIFYILFGMIGNNWPHIFAGLITLFISYSKPPVPHKTA